MSKKNSHPARCVCRRCQDTAVLGGEPGVHILPQQRIGDAEKDACLARLHRAYETGRLDRAELDARTDAALTARTAQELSFLLQDLTVPPISGKVPAARRMPAFTGMDVLIYAAGTTAPAVALAAGSDSPAYSWILAFCLPVALLNFFVALCALAHVILARFSRSA